MFSELFVVNKLVISSIDNNNQIELFADAVIGLNPQPMPSQNYFLDEKDQEAAKMTVNWLKRRLLDLD